MIGLLKTCFLYGWLLLLGVFDRCRKWANPSGSAASYAYTRAESIALEGCPNLFRVDATLYRGAQPTRQGFDELEKMGVRTVLSLRSLHGNEHLMDHTRLRSFRIPMKTWDPQIEHIRGFLSVVSDPRNHPVFVHCLHGSDRTGVMTAVYRMVMQEYSYAEAVEEMTQGPFGYHRIWEGLPGFLKELDIETLRAEYHAHGDASLTRT